MSDLISWLVDTSVFSRRGMSEPGWTPALIRIYIAADVTCFVAHLLAPIYLTLILRRIRNRKHFGRVLTIGMLLFGAAVGIPNLTDSFLFYFPFYRVHVALKVVGAVVAVVTLSVLPCALAWATSVSKVKRAIAVKVLGESK